MITDNTPWQFLPRTSPFVLSGDKEIISRFNQTAVDDYRVQLDALPEPYFGDRNASVVLLGLNPGYDDKDPVVHSDPGFQTLLRNNYLHQPAEYPFYFLNPNYENPGRDWWEKKLKPLLIRVPRIKLAKSLFCVEYFPYHSRKYSHAKLALSCQQYGFSLVREAMQRQAVIVLMRASKLWRSTIPELNDYPGLCTLNSPQNVVISERNCPKFDDVLAAING